MDIQKRVKGLAEDAVLEVGEVKILNKHATFPTKTITKSKILVEEVNKLKGNGATINEIFKEIPEDILEKADELYEEKITQRIRKGIEKDLVNFVFLNWQGKKVPNSKEIELMTAIQYYHSDCVIPPLLSRVFPRLKAKEADKFIRFVLNFFEYAERLNKKPKLGYLIVSSAQKAINAVLETYHNLGVQGIVVDFDGKNPFNKTTSIALLRHKLIHLYGDEIPIILYAINVAPYERTHAEINSANDVFLYEMGFNILGDKHKRRVMPIDVVEKIKQKPSNIKTGWIFDNKDYGYHNISLRRDNEKHFLTWNNFLTENNILSSIVKEEGKVIDHISNKKYAKKESIEILKELQLTQSDIIRDLKQRRTLDEYIHPK